MVDVFVRAGHPEMLEPSHLYPTGVVAIASVWAQAHVASDERTCPLYPLAPQLTELGVHPKGGLRDAIRSGLHVCPTIGVLRLDSASGFATHGVMISEFDRWRQRRERVKTVIFVCTALTRLESAQAENLLELVNHARNAGFKVALCRLPDAAIETLARTGVGDKVGLDDIYPSVTGALAEAWNEAHPTSGDEHCPLEKLLPHVTELSLHEDGSYRNSARYSLARCRHISMVRFDGRLDYSTLSHFGRGIDSVVDNSPELRCLIIAGHTLERIDEEAAEGLMEVFDRLRKRGLRVCVSGLRDEVIDVLRQTGVRETIGEKCIFPTQAKAIESAYEETHQDSDENHCPLIEVVPLTT